jgi:RTX calcium-binding nonapeptide repeat (4 copies)
MLRTLAVALALLAVAAPSAAAHSSDAEIFATDNTAVITDPDDPRLDDRLHGFAHRVTRIIDDGGGRPRGSQLLDGVFFGDELTFERSRRFDVDNVSDAELHGIAETIRRRFLQQSVLTFDHLHPADRDVNAVELEVPGISARDLQQGLVDDQEARERLFGGSVTLDRRLLLVAALEDAQFARGFAKRIGGDLKRVRTSYGEREFVEVATGGRARIENRALLIIGTPEDDRLKLHEGRRLEIDFGDDGVIDYEVSPRRFDRLRIDLGAGEDDVVVHEGSAGDDRIELDGHGLAGVERVEVAAGDGDDTLIVDDALYPAGVWGVQADLGAADGDLDRVVVHDSDEGNQTSVSFFSNRVSVLAGVWTTLTGAEPTDRLRVNGNDGDDIVSASTDAMALTLDGGDGDNVILGGPGRDTLIGGDGFDDVKGGRGDDTAYLRGDFNRFSWAPGDGSDTVEGGPTRDSMFFTGSADAETFELERAGNHARFTRDVGNIVMDLDGIDSIEATAGAGADTFRVGDVRGTDVSELNASLAPGGGAGDPDRVEIEGTDGDDTVAVSGKKVVFGSVTVTGLPVKLGISFAEAARDTLLIDTLEGDDTVDTSGLAPDVIGLEVN